LRFDAYPFDQLVREIWIAFNDKIIFKRILMSKNAAKIPLKVTY